MINTTNEGSKLYLYSITSVAILGGLLFGYDTAVISGAEKGLEAFFLSASDFQYNKVMPVSYTHLDVYKRQAIASPAPFTIQPMLPSMWT